jgi:hypothetical protein
MNIPTANSPYARAMGVHGGVAMLAQGIGSVLLWLNHLGNAKQVRECLKTEHAERIRESFAQGRGVLIVTEVSICTPNMFSLPVETLRSVFVQSGHSREEALAAYSKLSFIRTAEPSWCTREQRFAWIAAPRRESYDAGWVQESQLSPAPPLQVSQPPDAQSSPNDSIAAPREVFIAPLK